MKRIPVKVTVTVRLAESKNLPGRVDLHIRNQSWWGLTPRQAAEVLARCFRHSVSDP